MSSTVAASSHEVALFRHQAKLVGSTVEVNVAGISDDESLIAPQPAGSCANWILGHMLDSYERTLPLLDEEQLLPVDALARYRRGTPPITDPGDAIDFSTLWETWVQANERIDSGLRRLTPEALAREDTYFGKGTALPLARYLNFILFHQAYHAGQLGILRRVAGKEGAIQ